MAFETLGEHSGTDEEDIYDRSLWWMLYNGVEIVNPDSERQRFLPTVSTSGTDFYNRSAKCDSYLDNVQ